jgi:uncharacterized protein DUF6883
MKMPNADQAVIDRHKIVDYCLSFAHDDGQHKARLFATVLGLTIRDADLLIDALRSAAVTKEAILGKNDGYGQRYLIDFEFQGRSRAAMIRSAWIIRLHEEVPRLVTCYIL